jgi:hypothetical protein
MPVASSKEKVMSDKDTAIGGKVQAVVGETRLDDGTVVVETVEVSARAAEEAEFFQGELRFCPVDAETMRKLCDEVEALHEKLSALGLPNIMAVQFGLDRVMQHADITPLETVPRMALASWDLRYGIPESLEDAAARCKGAIRALERREEIPGYSEQNIVTESDDTAEVFGGGPLN